MEFKMLKINSKDTDRWSVANDGIRIPKSAAAIVMAMCFTVLGSGANAASHGSYYESRL